MYYGNLELPPRLSIARVERIGGKFHEWFNLSDRFDRRHHGDPVIPRTALMTAPSEVDVTPRPDGVAAPSSYVSWSPVVVGALVATALSSILLTFGITVGLGVSSAAPTWRDASASLALLSGLYLIIQAMISFGVGGYIAGRARAEVGALDAEAKEHRDGLHGLATWALAVILGATLTALIGSATLTRSNAAPAMPTRVSTAEPLLSYELDRMFRPARRPGNTDVSEARAEAGRILLTWSSHGGMTTEDRTYLIQLLAGTTGLSGPDAERRVDSAIANAKVAIAKLRRSSVILAFSVAAALLIGAAISWAAACEGGRHRDGEPLPRWMKAGKMPRSRGMP